MSHLTLALLSVATLATGSPLDELADRVDAYLAAAVADQQLSGSLLVAKGDEVLLERHYGFADFELGVPVTAATRFCVASVTKPMTQAVVIPLIVEGVLGADDRIARWLPEFPGAETITVMHLLSHRAGIPHRVTSREDEATPQTAATMTALAAKRPLLGPAGAESVYSSAGYSVLARVAELATGRTFQDLLAERVFGPAGMSATCDAVGRELIPSRAKPYASVPGGVVHTPLEEPSFLVGAGSVHSTPRDLFRLVRAVVDGRLGESVRANALSRGKLDWSGATNGYRCFVQHDPASQFTVIFAGNVATGAVERAKSDLMGLVQGAEVPALERLEVDATQPEAGALVALEGLYDLRGTPLRLEAHGAYAWLGAALLVPTGKDRFFATRDYAEVTVTRGADGAVTGLNWRTGEFTLEMRRL